MWAPGAGKSTGAAHIFAELKMCGINTELVTEFAKDKVLEGNKEVFNTQIYLFGKQVFKLSRCNGKVDVIITDSPLPLSIYYKNRPCYTENFDGCVLDIFNSFNSVNYFLNRVKPYNPSGRFQTEEESDQVSIGVKSLLDKYNIVIKSVLVILLAMIL